ncbi:type II toxin-antitoxin system PemK/MazF family toxin [Giesbergeria anulus]|uniref:type II toxin-antitoxin system PemK/MazF family toxin n=1 Tax=Giesbergeria anulus TaxID=180197 RepID=UPI000B868CC6|nr:type II toxin-antitoxin system PemK/MazF family toxin [Giesbergeria anulus]
MKRGDIYLVSLDPTAGHEQSGSRPVLVVSPGAFNQATKLPVVLPITNGGDFARRLGFFVSLEGTKTTGIIRCDQPRVLDLAARNGRKIESLPDSIMDEVLAKVSTIFE